MYNYWILHERGKLHCNARVSKYELNKSILLLRKVDTHSKQLFKKYILGTNTISVTFRTKENQPKGKIQESNHRDLEMTFP